MENRKQIILLIEDEHEQREALCMLFESIGYELHAKESAEEGLVLLESSLPDIIVTDVKLGGLDGISFFEQIRADDRYQKIPFIFITGYNDPVAIARVNSLGANGYITKPYELETLLEMVRTTLATKMFA